MLSNIFRSMLAALGIGMPLDALSASALDDQMKEVAAFFAGKIRGATDVLLAAKLDRSKLDLSLESLHAVDDWLKTLAAARINPLSEDAAETMVWAGAYVGEVIRACSTKQYTWKRYGDYMPSQPASLRDLIPNTFGTQFMLVSASGGVTLPLNKVVRVLAEGPENNLHYYASGECR